MSHVPIKRLIRDFHFSYGACVVRPGRHSANIRGDAGVDGSPTEDAHVAMDEAAPVEGLLLGGAQMHSPGKALSGN